MLPYHHDILSWCHHGIMASYPHMPKSHFKYWHKRWKELELWIGFAVKTFHSVSSKSSSEGKSMKWYCLKPNSWNVVFWRRLNLLRVQQLCFLFIFSFLDSTLSLGPALRYLLHLESSQHYRVNQETCDLWDIWSEWRNKYLPTYLPIYLHLRTSLNIKEQSWRLVNFLKASH